MMEWTGGSLAFLEGLNLRRVMSLPGVVCPDPGEAPPERPSTP